MSKRKLGAGNMAIVEVFGTPHICLWVSEDSEMLEHQQ